MKKKRLTAVAILSCILASASLFGAQTNTSASTNADGGFVKSEANETASALSNSWKAAKILQQTGDADKLFSAAREMTARWPQDARSWYYLGNAYYMKGQTEDACAAYKHSIELNPRLYNTWANLGTCYSIAGDHEQAIGDFKESLRLQSDCDNWLKLGIDQEAIKDFTGAIASYLEATKLQPTNELGWATLGMSLLKQNRFDETISTMNQALKIMPKDESFYTILIGAYMKSGKFAEMMSASMELAKINPSNEMAKSFGNILSKMKEAQLVPFTTPALTNETLTSGMPRWPADGKITDTNLRVPISFTNSLGDFITDAIPARLFANKLIYITTNGGGGTIRLEKLPPDLQGKFGYDPQAAQAADMAEQQKKMREQQFYQQQKEFLDQQARRDAALKMAMQHRYQITGRVIQKISDGLLISMDTTGNNNYVTLLLIGYPNYDNVAADDHVSQYAFGVGTYKYTTVNHSENTIHAFNCDTNAAVEYYLTH